MPSLQPAMPDDDGGVTRYAYKRSLVGAAQQFELRADGLSFATGRRAAVWPYQEIVAVRLSYRPVSMQSRRFRADITHRGGRRLSLVSTTWQTAALMAPQDGAYRAFIMELHRRLAAAGGDVTLSAGLRPWVYRVGLALIGLVAAAMAALLIRALLTGDVAAMLFIAGFTALFGWQVGGFIWRNRPRRYSFGALPPDLVP